MGVRKNLFLSYIDIFSLAVMPAVIGWPVEGFPFKNFIFLNNQISETQYTENIGPSQVPCTNNIKARKRDREYIVKYNVDHFYAKNKTPKNSFPICWKESENV